MIHYDLHLHSRASDGALAPAELVSLCAANGVQVMALTDHDTLAGINEARLAAEQIGLNLIVGTELTCLWNRRSIHILGLGLDDAFEGVNDYQAELFCLRQERAERISERLIKKGVDASIFDLAMRYSEGGQIGRPHFAKALVKLRNVKTLQEAFDHYLGQNKVGDVKALWPDLRRSVEFIRQAGGIAVIAHPTKYKMTFTKLRELVADFKKVGGEGIEVGYPGLNPDQGRELIKLATQQDLLMSAGSDFHNSFNAWTLPGRFPALEVNEQHVLNRLLL
ncbi:PHP domain-containing protein [Nitrincola alkalisediminis]|uniref:PHP domain-containing protein n=1 Tax=Nitrincola alkalisediminis TaxID=1366656 RepID=UPI0018748B06|nr:PHP domain-containing protein [Nitrincola alkalisediminis]